MALTTHPSKSSSNETPYQLDPDQTLKASKALLEHLRLETERLQANSTTKNLLKSGDSDSEAGDASEGRTPIWLNITTKQHMVDSNRLKPSKINVPHSLNASPELSVCIFAADPQRSLKDAIANDAFPPQLATRITKVIGLTKLKANYKSFEQRRALRDEHDIFLADDRIINRLPDTLGKIFYKSTTKRPVPIRIEQLDRVEGKRVKASKDNKKSDNERHAKVAAPGVVAKEITRAIDAVPIHMKPGTGVAVRVALSTFSPEQVTANVQAVVESIIDKHIAKGWRNIKSIHIKSPTSTALPVWLSDELWAEDEAVKALEEVDDANSLKRKRKPTTSKGPQSGQRKKARVSDQSEDGQRQQRLAADKAKAFSNTAKAVMV